MPNTEIAVSTNLRLTLHKVLVLFANMCGDASLTVQIHSRGCMFCLLICFMFSLVMSRIMSVVLAPEGISVVMDFALISSVVDRLLMYWESEACGKEMKMILLVFVLDYSCLLD